MKTQLIALLATGLFIHSSAFSKSTADKINPLRMAAAKEYYAIKTQPVTPVKVLPAQTVVMASVKGYYAITGRYRKVTVGRAEKEVAVKKALKVKGYYSIQQ